MREFITNFQKKHGQQVPMPKIYGDEDSTDSEGPELADGTKVVKKTTGGACGGDGPSTSGENMGRPKGKKQGRDDGGNDDPTKRRKTGENAPPKPMVAHKEPRKKTTGYPLLTESCQSFTSPARKRGPCLVTVCWTGLTSRRGRSMRGGCRGDR